MDKNIIEFLRKKPQWMQQTFSLLQKKSILDEADYDRLTNLCFKETNSLSLNGDDIIEQNNINTQQGKKQEGLFILKIENPKGINNLAPRNPLILKDFNDNTNLTIIYGENGVGKSGYVRLLKTICGAKHKGNLLCNVYEKEHREQETHIIYQLNGKMKKLIWKPENGINDDLKFVEIYDRECGDIYVNDANELTYEPKELHIFTKLIDACTQIGNVLRNKMEAITIPKSIPEKRLALTESIQWYNQISEDTTNEEFELKTKWNENDELELKDLNERVQTSLPSEKAKDLRKQFLAIIEFIKFIRPLRVNVSQKSIDKYYLLKNTVNINKRAAETYATNFFTEIPLKGVGTDVWKVLWSYAKKYSEEYAYPNKKFPVYDENARCVLCHQKLDENTKERFKSFDEFILNQVEREYNNSQERFEEYKMLITKMPVNETYNMKFEKCQISEEEIKEGVNTFYQEYEKYILSLNTVIKSNYFNQRQSDLVFHNLLTKAREIKNKAQIYENDSKNLNRQQLHDKIKELDARKLLSDSKEHIMNEIQKYRLKSQYTKAIRAADTTFLSKKKSELSEIIITEEFKKRFLTELKKLNALNIKVELKKVHTTKGHVLHKIVLLDNVNYPAKDILSEGEYRIISLAAFFADVHQQENSNPFIFDDPITSLDYAYEEATIKRLIELAMTRQVVIFTHRISLLSSLKFHAKGSNLPYRTVLLTKETWGCGEPSEEFFETLRPENALNKIRYESIPQAKKTIDQSGKRFYIENRCGLICRDIRKILEEMIEKILLGEVVLRYRRDINTLGKLEHLSIISTEDTYLLERMMSKYSTYVHSQSAETPEIPLMPEEIESDVIELIKWIEEFNKRKKAIKKTGRLA